MQQVFILLATLAGGIHAFLPAADTKCDATQDVTSCNATSGGSVYIQVMANASGHVVYCKKNTTSGFTTVFTLKNQQVKVNKDNAQFFIGNGTLKITGLSKNDTGRYSFDIFNQNGVHLRNITVHLHVQDSQLLLILILVIACAALLLLVILSVICCVCRKRSASRKQQHTTSQHY